jgi:hypothetical protein
MVFAINAVDASPRNFSAFQAIAEQLNGTGTTPSASGSAPSSPTGAALSLRVGGGASVIFTVIAIVASLL